MTSIDWIGLLADIIGIGTLIFTVIVFWRARRRLTNALKALQIERSPTPVALVIGIGQNIEAAVKTHLVAANSSMPIYNYARIGQVPNSRFHEVLRDVLKIKQEITDAGATEVHLFYMGPVTLSVGIGAIIDNWLPVVVYKFVNGDYEPEFVLHKETVLGLLDEVVESGVDLMV